MSGLTVAEVLDAAADLIEPEGKWTQGAFSRNADGAADADEDETTAVEPVCWCALGALAEVSGKSTLDSYVFALAYPDRAAPGYAALRAFIGGEVADWNDAPERTQAEVVAKLREAAAAAREVQS